MLGGNISWFTLHQKPGAQYVYVNDKGIPRLICSVDGIHGIMYYPGIDFDDNVVIWICVGDRNRHHNIENGDFHSFIQRFDCTNEDESQAILDFEEGCVMWYNKKIKKKG